MAKVLIKKCFLRHIIWKNASSVNMFLTYQCRSPENGNVIRSHIIFKIKIIDDATLCLKALISRHGNLDSLNVACVTQRGLEYFYCLIMYFNSELLRLMLTRRFYKLVQLNARCMLSHRVKVLTGQITGCYCPLLRLCELQCQLAISG